MSDMFSPASRRQFLQGAGLMSVIASGATTLFSSKALAAVTGGWPSKSIYHKLGIRPLINAAGTYTMLSACTMPREVVLAMEDAARYQVSIDELHQAVGKKIASLTGAEGALVTAGAANALTLATAACIAGKDQQRISRLPDTEGMRDEVIIQKAHRVAYEHAIRSAGGRLVEVETRDQMVNAIGGNTAMMFFLNFADPRGQVKRPEFVEIARKAKVPTLIDAAADVPPPGRLSEYVKMGFDLVAFSGGKGLRGPQCSGLLLGRKELIEAAYLNGSPHADSVSRGAKVGKEEIVGLWTAVEVYMKKDHKAEWSDWESRVRVIRRAVEGLRGVTSEVYVPEIANESPHVRISWDPKVLAMKNNDVRKLLRDSDPRIEITPSDGALPNLVVSVWMLQPGQDRIVARRVREVLSKNLS